MSSLANWIDHIMINTDATPLLGGTWNQSELEGFGLSKESMLFAYYVAAANIFEPEGSLERLAWAKTTDLLQILELNFKDEETRNAFVDQFNKCIIGGNYSYE
ncbi:putative ent-copalyl diphosphate synthase [Medicago truncatula]|nr:putative ent-copalyl diphosphate synthase [Medicago truncatula]